MAADTISVRVSGKGPVRKYITGERAVIPRGSTMSMLVSSFRIPGELPIICLKDGKRIPPATELHDGDTIILITLMSGG